MIKYPEYDDHEFVITLRDKKSGLNAFIAIHSRARGMAHGGTRMKHYESDEDALRDALKLSRAMSYKSALADLPYGGAKGVIALPDGEYDKSEVLKAYAQKITALGGLFHTGTDVGLSDEDALIMARECVYILGTKANDAGYSTSKTAALGVYTAIKAAAKHKYGTEDLNNKKIGVKGVGKLGAELVRLLLEDGAEVVAADVNESSIRSLTEQYTNVTVLSPEEIIDADIDVYAPCAMGEEFDQGTIERLKCDIIAGGANNQLVDAQAGDLLFQKGILYAPDYIANAGGLIFICEDLEKDGFRLDRLRARVEKIGDTLTMIFQRSAEQNIPPNRVADQLAQERING
jgi:glutamate dehydrogenase/leucine dehydrogenase